MSARSATAEAARGQRRRGAAACWRTESLFLVSPTPPSEDEQAADTRPSPPALGGLPLTLRTLDVGGDKAVDYLQIPAEENPALGLRGISPSASGVPTFCASRSAPSWRHAARPVPHPMAPIHLVRPRRTRSRARHGRRGEGGARLQPSRSRSG